MALIEARDLRKHFAIGGLVERLLGESRVVRALDGVSFALGPARTLGVVGESGSGKTTLGRTLVRLYRPTSGRVIFRGRDISTLPEGQLRPMRREFQMIFQDPLASLNPRRSVGDIIATSLRVHGMRHGLRARVDEALQAVGLEPRIFRDRFPYQLSGGQAQRVSLARTLVLDPKLIVADEPVSALDVSVRAQIVNLLQELQREFGIAYVFVAHDLSVVRHLSHNVMVMYLGRTMEAAPAEELFRDPLHPYTRALLAAVPRIGPRRRERIILPGSPPSPIDPPRGCPFHPRCPVKIGPICEDVRPALVSPRPGCLVACHLYTEADGSRAGEADRQAASETAASHAPTTTASSRPFDTMPSR